MKKPNLISLMLLTCVTAQAQWTEVGKISSTSMGTIGTPGNYSNSYIYVTDGFQKMGIDPNQIYAGQDFNVSASTFIKFFTADVERIKILANGKIGIGNSTQIESKFEINHSGTIGAKWDPASSYFKLTDGTVSLIADGNEIYTNQALAIGSSYNHPIYFRNVDSNGKTDLMTIASDGKIGIGVTDPEHGKLQIYGSGASEGITLWTNQGELTSRIWIDPISQLFHFSRGDNPLKGFTLDNDGNLSIGSLDNGSHKLAVEGSIGAREIKVEASGWSDFVFEKEYNLRTLEEVEDFIAENKHLPEIPSEAEVTENGVNLGEMNAKLLQKIEELTLYLIEQNKQNQSQQARIEQLEKKISQLENE